MFVELVLENVEYVLFMLVDLVPQRLALVEGEVLHTGADFGCRILVGFYGIGYVGHDLIDFVAELIVGEVGERGSECVDFVYYGLDFLEVALRFVAKELAQN